MFADTRPLLARLRRHRGWLACVLAVLLIKLVTTSVCLGDGLNIALANGAGGPVATQTVHAGDACLLGEGADCHCACAHALTVTSSGVTPPQRPAWQPLIIDMPASDHVPGITGALLRPPIA